MKIILYLTLIFIMVEESYAQNCPEGYTSDMDMTYCCHSGADNMPFENSGWGCFSAYSHKDGYGTGDEIICWNGLNDTITPTPQSNPPNFEKTNGRCLNYVIEQPTPGWFKPGEPKNLRIANLVPVYQ